MVTLPRNAGQIRPRRRKPWFALPRVVAGLALLVSVAFGFAVPLVAAPDIRLVMVEAKGCRFCRQWDTDVGKSYAKSAEGHFAPLKRVSRGAPELTGLNPVVYTPTFIVMRSGEEVGRITGYPGAEFFWSELATLLSTVGYFPAL